MSGQTRAPLSPLVGSRCFGWRRTSRPKPTSDTSTDTRNQRTLCDGRAKTTQSSMSGPATSPMTAPQKCRSSCGGSTTSGGSKCSSSVSAASACSAAACASGSLGSAARQADAGTTRSRGEGLTQGARGATGGAAGSPASASVVSSAPASPVAGSVVRGSAPGCSGSSSAVGWSASGTGPSQRATMEAKRASTSRSSMSPGRSGTGSPRVLRGGMTIFARRHVDQARRPGALESGRRATKGGPVIYWVLKTVILGPILRLLFRPWVDGAEHIPETGPAIFASNHLSFSDSIFLPLVVPRRMTFLAKSDYFTGEGMKGRMTAAFFKGVGQLPVDRSGGRASEAALRSGLKVLNRGDLLGLYPEGTRSPDGRLYKGKTGVARMALEAGVPVIPVAMIDTDKAQPTGTKIPKLIRVGVRVGTPLDFSRYEGMEGDRFVLRSITDEIMYALMELSGQEYVDMYATAMKDRIAREKKNKAKEAAEAAQPGRAASELEDALDGLDDPGDPDTDTGDGDAGTHRRAS